MFEERCMRIENWVFLDVDVQVCDFENRGVVVILYFWEFGMDNSFVWDEFMKFCIDIDFFLYVCCDLIYVDVSMWLMKDIYDYYFIFLYR